MLQTVKNLPGVIDLRRIAFEKKFSTHTNVNYFRGVFKTFKEAQLSSPRTKPVGYNNVDSARLYKERIDRVFSTDYPVLYWMKHFQNSYQSVFDFGGHVGIHYYSYSKFLNYDSINSWTVCDVESVTEEGRLLATQKNASKLKFVNHIEQADGFDLFLASGSLQYLEWELNDKLKKLNSPPQILILNMLPLHKTLKTITLQSIGTSFCPYYLRKETDFINDLEKIGYKLLDIWNNEEKKCNIAFESERSLSHYKGLIFTRSNN